MTRQTRFGLWLVAIGFTLFCAAQLMAEVKAGTPETDQKGCWFVYSSGSGRLHPQPFVKTGDKDFADENGNPEIWGFFLNNLPEPDENGQIRPVNVRADMFVPADGRLHEVPTGTTTRKVKCTLWAKEATQTADASR